MQGSKNPRENPLKEVDKSWSGGLPLGQISPVSQVYQDAAGALKFLATKDPKALPRNARHTCGLQNAQETNIDSVEVGDRLHVSNFVN